MKIYKASTSKRSVLDERFLKCGECHERFWDNSKLIEHMESHAETKLLLCTICNKTFSVVQDLDKHYLLHRVLMQPFGCPACESRFATQDQLVKHVEKIHPELTIGDQEKPHLEMKATRKNLPRSTKAQIRIESIQSLSSPVKSSTKKGKSPNQKVDSKAALKKSILKVAPTPSGKKRPVVWKNPVVSPEQNVKRNVISVQYTQSPGEKRRLVSASADSSVAKKLKLVSPAPAEMLPVTSTPMKKTPITKTKLMQNISNLYDNQTQEGTKSIAQTRKDLLNALTITPVTKGPIRVVKSAKPFIIYSPSKETKAVQFSSSLNASDSNVSLQKSTSGSVTYGKLNVSKQNKNVSECAGRAFDKLFVSKTISLSQNNSGTTEMQQLSFETKKQISPSKVSTVQLFPITQKSLKPELTIHATQTVSPNINSVKLVKNVTVVSPTGNTKLVQPIAPICKFPPDLKIIPQPSILKTVQSSPVDKYIPTCSSSKTTTVASPRKLKVSVSPTIDVEPQLISENEVHRDPTLKSQKLQILFPSIKLRKITEAEFLKETSKGLVTAINNNVTEASNSEISNNLQSGTATEAKGVKRRGRQQFQEGRTVSKQIKIDSSPENSATEQLAVTKANTKDNMSLKKLPSAKAIIPKQTNVKNSGIVGTKTRSKLQLIAVTSTKVDKPSVSKTADKANQQSVQSNPHSTKRNVANKTTKLPKDKICSETEQTLAVIRRSNRSGTRAVKAEVTDSEVQKVTAPTIRRSKRTLAGSVSSPKTPTRRNILKKTPIEKDILKKVIEEVNLTDAEEKRETGIIQENLVEPTPVSPAHNKIRVVTLTPEVMNKLKATVLKKTTSNTPNHIRLVVPSEVLCRIQNATLKKQTEGSPSTSAMPKPPEGSPLSNLKISVVPKNIVRYGVEDLKRIKQEEKEKMDKKEEILKKMMVKFEEKEMKKQIKFCEKKLTRFLDKHQEKHLEKLKERLLNVRNLSLEEGAQLLQDVVTIGCKTCKEVIGKTMCVLGFGDEKDLFQDKAVEGLVALSTSKAKSKLNYKKAGPSKKVLATSKAKKMLNGKKAEASKKPESKKKPLQGLSESQDKPEKASPKKCIPPRTAFSIIECAINKGDLSYSKKTDAKKSKPKAVAQMKNPVKIPRRKIQRKTQKQPFANDPFVDISIINAEDKFVIECPCMKPNCNGLHPENFFI